jgi:hypothetical protein
MNNDAEAFVDRKRAEFVLLVARLAQESLQRRPCPRWFGFLLLSPFSSGSNRNAKSAGTWAERSCLLALRKNEGRCWQGRVLVVEVEEALVAEGLSDFFTVASSLPSSRQVMNGTS